MVERISTTNTVRLFDSQAHYAATVQMGPGHFLEEETCEKIGSLQDYSLMEETPNSIPSDEEEAATNSAVGTLR